MGKTVLVVEDDSDIQEYYEIVLSDLPVKILKAANGQDALSIIDSGEKIDLIILDVIMPKMGGEKFLHELRLERKLIMPVIVTSVDQVSAIRLQEKMNVQDCFFKLAKADKLRALVNKHLNITPT